MSAAEPERVSVARATLTCRCPRCGKGKLFSGILQVAPRCPDCGLDFSGSDTGDSFSVPILLVLGTLIVLAAFWVDFRFQPPLWVHALLWPPITAALAVLMTRYLKSFFTVQQYNVRRSEMSGN